MPEHEYASVERWTIPCAADHGHYLHLAWDADEPAFRYAWLTEERGPVSLRQRLKDAISALRNRPYCYAEMPLDDRAVATLRDFLDARS
jgi:hypothetical protein